MVPFIKHYWNDQMIKKENKLVVVRAYRQGWERKVGMLIKGLSKASLWWLQCSEHWLWCQLHKCTHRIKLHRTELIQISTCNTDEIWDGLYQYQFPGCDIVLWLCKRLPLGGNGWWVYGIFPYHSSQLHVVRCTVILTTLIKKCFQKLGK